MKLFGVYIYYYLFVEELFTVCDDKQMVIVMFEMVRSSLNIIVECHRLIFSKKKKGPQLKNFFHICYWTVPEIGRQIEIWCWLFLLDTEI